MKERMLRLSSLLLVLWYCFSVVGFDIHTCKGSGKSFVSTFIGGTSCEDIHPEHKCDEAKCCAGSHKSIKDCCQGADTCGEYHIVPESCCSNDYLALTLTGGTSEERYRYDDTQVQIFYSVPSADNIPFIHPICNSDKLKIPDQRSVSRRDILSLNAVWRI